MLRNVLCLATLVLVTLPTAPTRIVGVFIRLSNEKDGLKFADRLRVDPKDVAWGIGGRQFYPYLLDYAKQHPCEALR